MTFESSFEELILVEGGYSDDPADSGGKTCYGITEETAREAGYSGPMNALPLSEAKRIYKEKYWDSLRLDDVAALSGRIANELFDTGVNCGIGVAASFLQRSLNVFNNQQAHYLDVELTSTVGPKTLESLRVFLNRRAPDGETVLLRALNALQGAKYIKLAEVRQKDEKFAFGWFLRRVRM